MLQLIVVTASVMEDKIGFKTFASVTWWEALSGIVEGWRDQIHDAHCRKGPGTPTPTPLGVASFIGATTVSLTTLSMMTLNKKMS
jgi:hypothetical protein